MHQRLTRGKKIKAVKTILNIRLQSRINYLGIRKKLHDVVEDTDVTVNDLKEAGFSDEVVSAVSTITKKAGEDYEEYLNRVKQNPIALRVKIADMEHNSDISRIPNPTEKDLNRLEKYKIRLRELREVLETR